MSGRTGLCNSAGWVLIQPSAGPVVAATEAGGSGEGSSAGMLGRLLNR